MHDGIFELLPIGIANKLHTHIIHIHTTSLLSFTSTETITVNEDGKEGENKMPSTAKKESFRCSSRFDIQL